MTAQEERDNQWLATEIMGWYCHDGPWWRNTGHKIVMAFSSWNPLHNIDQCFQYLKPKILKVKFAIFIESYNRINNKEYNIVTLENLKDEWIGESESLSEAFCLACKAAWEGK